MKEIYDWVRWFQELVKKIAEGGEAYLIDKAGQVDWGENRALTKYGDEGIDPFSFVYFLASKATAKQRKTVYESVRHEFGIENPLPDPRVGEYYIFPTPTSLNALFHDGQNFKNELLWRLFRQALPVHPEIEPHDFKHALDIKFVATPKLTQSLFLINPEFFLPVDDTYDVLSETRGFLTAVELKNEISEDGGYGKYQSFLGKIKEAFPKCQPYEINMFLYLQKPKTKNRIRVSEKWYQVSTFVDDPGNDDYWEDRDDCFKDNYCVFTGWDRYSKLTEPKPGDIMLVRTGIQKGRAIGVVYKNDYAENGSWTDNGRIHVLWINKTGCELPHGKVRRQPGFSQTYKGGVYSLFEKTDGYKNSIDLIETLRDDSSENKTEPDPANNTQMGQDPRIHPLNQILYGPPGTSKTWHTVNHALAIVDKKEVEPIENESEKVRKGKLHRFNELKENGQIEIVTFHQSYNYEDFIEGIRPVLDDDGNRNIEYELSEGVFKRISIWADENRKQSEQAGVESWDIDELLEEYAQSIAERLESEGEIRLFPPGHRSGVTIADINWSRGSFRSVQLGGMLSDQRLSKRMIERDYEAFYNGDIKSLKDIKPTHKSNRGYHGNARFYFELFKRVREFHDNEWTTDRPTSVEKQNYVLIIDEINRGNIAKIFGELITLIEDSKRTGGNDAATVTLPYTKEKFGVPDNLYIIGTMNTADRSIAPLDTALRRRFNFVEMMPDPTLVPDDIEGVKCRRLLKVMNDRIRVLLDREHQIGHTYFMGVSEKDSLVAAFKSNIIPLLQEYFYDDWEKIDLVLNRNGFIQKNQIDSDLFKESDLIEKQSKIYELLPVEQWQYPKQFRKIYENDKQGDGGEREEDA